MLVYVTYYIGSAIRLRLETEAGFHPPPLGPLPVFRYNEDITRKK